MVNRECGNCVFFVRYKDREDGDCKRYPPVPVSESLIDGYGNHRYYPRTQFPNVWQGDWCGEMKPIAREEECTT